MIKKESEEGSNEWSITKVVPNSGAAKLVNCKHQPAVVPRGICPSGSKGQGCYQRGQQRKFINPGAGTLRVLLLIAGGGFVWHVRQGSCQKQS